MFILLGILLQVFVPASNGQESNPSMDRYAYQVKHIEDFMSRFNGDVLTIDSTQFDNFRVSNLIFLFDENTYHENMECADSIIQRQVDLPIKLDYTYQNWEAIATCNVEYAGKREVIELTLKTQHIKDVMYKWVITQASGRILSLTPSKTNAGLKISPTDNSVNFISLAHITSVEAVNIINYADSSYKVDPVTVFYTLVHEKKLKVTDVQKIRYRFINIHGFDLIVTQQVKDKTHAGWLITDIYPHEEH